MKVSNTTPFPYLLYQKVGKKDELFNVIALRQTFRLKTGGHYSDLNEQQYPLNMADRYYHAPETSSLIEETDLVWTRPCTNIHILGVARLKAISLRHNGEQVFALKTLAKRGLCLALTIGNTKRIDGA